MEGSAIGYVIIQIGLMFNSFVEWLFSIYVGDLPITFGGLILFAILFNVALRFVFGFRGSVGSTHNNNTKKQKKDIKSAGDSIAERPDSSDEGVD